MADETLHREIRLSNTKPTKTRSELTYPEGPYTSCYTCGIHRPFKEKKYINFTDNA